MVWPKDGVSRETIKLKMSNGGSMLVRSLDCVGTMLPTTPVCTVPQIGAPAIVSRRPSLELTACPCIYGPHVAQRRSGVLLGH